MHFKRHLPDVDPSKATLFDAFQVVCHEWATESDPPKFKHVQSVELAAVLQRREAAGLLSDNNQVPAAEDVQTARNNLVGLALSGGGIRSASFNLGLLQSFYTQHLLGHID